MMDVPLQISSLSAMSEMREHDELCDIIIKVGNETFAAHRVVLASAIPYFRAMFRSNMIEYSSKEITMENIDPAALKCIIDLVYTGNLKLASEDMVPSLVQTASFLLLDSVVDTCLDFLWKNIDPENAVTVYECAANISFNVQIIEKTERYIRHNFADVSKSTTFPCLSLASLKAFLLSDDLYVLKEETVFESVMTWINAEADRCIHLPELLQCVRIPLLQDPTYSAACKDQSALCIQERYCKEKQHLKCTKLMGYSMYLVSVNQFHNMSINHYDHINGIWTELYCTSEIGYADYLACTEDMIYIVELHNIQTLNLKTLENSVTKIQKITGLNFPTCAGATLYNKCLYLVGGLFSSANLVHCLHLETSECYKIGKISIDRTRPGIVLVEDNIYITGGCDNKKVHNSAEKFNMTTGKSTKIASMLYMRYEHGCNFLNDKIYVCGGFSNSSSYFSNVAEVYDPKINQWNCIAKLDCEKRVRSIFSHANELFLIDANFHNNIDVYDTDTDKWKYRRLRCIPASCQKLTSAVVLTNSATSF